MSKHHPISWLAEHAALPVNVTRVIDRRVAEPARAARAAVADATPFGDGIETRLRQADAALERAQELEEVAADKAVRAREASEEVDVVRQAGAEDVERARREADHHAEQVVKEAQREADEYVAAKRQRAEENADRDVNEVRDQAEGRAAKAEDRAAQERDRAEEAIAQARTQMTEARRLAEDAAQSAREAAEEARGRADRLAQEADDRVEQAERRTQAVTTEGRNLAVAADAGPLELDDMSKAELLEFAQGMGLDVNGHQLEEGTRDGDPSQARLIPATPPPVTGEDSPCLARRRSDVQWCSDSATWPGLAPDESVTTSCSRRHGRCPARCASSSTRCPTAHPPPWRAPLVAPGTTATSSSAGPDHPCSSASTWWRDCSGCASCASMVTSSWWAPAPGPLRWMCRAGQVPVREH